MIQDNESAATEKQQRSPEEQDFIKAMERLQGSKMTGQEINLSLDQARAIGDF
jgi:hypothetical protein